MKPKVYVLTEKLIPIFLIYWFCIFAAIGVLFIGFIEGLIIPLIGIVMSLFSYWVVRTLLFMPKYNDFNFGKKLFKYAIGFFWAGLVFSSIFFLLSSAYSLAVYELEKIVIFFYFTSSAFPLAGAFGASKQWDLLKKH